MTHVGWFYCGSSSHPGDLKPMEGGWWQTVVDHGKRRGGGRKMLLILLCGLKKHADYSLRSDSFSCAVFQAFVDSPDGGTMRLIHPCPLN